MRLGILGSTRGSNLLPLFKAIIQHELNASIELVVSNKADALILDKAKTHHLRHYFLDPKGLSREAYDQQLSLLFMEQHIDLLVLIGYMRILSANFIDQWQHKIINVHPSLLPAYAGLCDLNVHQAVINAGEHYSGCSVHYVTEEVDAGEVIIQRQCPVLSNDTAQTLKNRVQKLEGQALIDAVKWLQCPR